jgi:hypothetical protein
MKIEVKNINISVAAKSNVKIIKYIFSFSHSTLSYFHQYLFCQARVSATLLQKYSFFRGLGLGSH